MKKLFYLVCGLFLAVACDVVSDPYGDRESAGPGEEEFNDTVYNDTSVTRRRILLEDFTGHKCPNCPEGAEIAQELKDDNPEDVISVAIHAGSFARVDTTNPDKPYPSDFNTETGENLRIQYQIGAFPNGLLNRSIINGSPVVDYIAWKTEVNNLLNDPAYMEPRFKLNLTNIYNSELGNRSLRILYKVEALKDLQGDYALAAYLMESHIIAPQTDSRQNPSYVADYEHNYVLRKGFPNVGQGKTIFMNPQQGDIAEVISSTDEISTTIPDEWLPENMDVIVFVYQPSTGEIFGVEKMPLSNQ